MRGPPVGRTVGVFNLSADLAANKFQKLGERFQRLAARIDGLGLSSIYGGSLFHPKNEIRPRRLAAQLPELGRALSPVALAVHTNLQ